MPTAKQDKTRKNGLTVKDLIVMGVFRCAIDGLLYDREAYYLLSPDSYFLFLHRSRFRGQYFSSCKSAKALGIDNYWGHYFSA